MNKTDKLCRDCSRCKPPTSHSDYGYCPHMMVKFTRDAQGCYWWEKKHEEKTKNES